MSTKKTDLDLSSYKEIGTNKTQYKHNKYTIFFENELNNQAAKANNEYKRINMAFTDNNYEMVQDEASRLNISLAFFVNTLIRTVKTADVDAYIEAQPIKRTKNNVARRKGEPAQRINIKFPMDTYSKIVAGSKLYDQTITQYVNTIIEVYTQEKYK